MGFPLSSSRREAVCPSSAFSGSHHTHASYLGWGAILHPHRVSRVWSRKEALDLINSLELKAVLLTLQNLESHVLGRSVLICSDIMTVVSFINLSGRNSFLIPVSAGLGPVGMVSSEEYFSSRQLTFREKRSLWRIFSPRESISFRMGPESFSFSEVLEVRRGVFSLDGSSTCTRFLPSLFSPGSWTRLPRISGSSPGCSVLASEALVSLIPSALGRSS